MGETPTIRELIVDDIADIIQRAEAIYGNSTQYSIFKNCEHLKNFVLFGEAESEQLQKALIGAGAGALISYTLLKDQPLWIKLGAVSLCSLGALHYEKQNKLSY